MNILLDGMGGDHAPEEIVKGAVMAAREIPETILIIGPEETINECLRAERWKGDNIRVVHATEVISNNEPPVMAIRRKKDSTIVRGMQMMKQGEADVFISGGSTGALLSAGLFILGRIQGIKRPAIAAFFPKIGQDDTTLILDCGANAECKPEHLLQNGIMGSIFVECVKGIPSPEVRLLNIGAEEEKGDQVHKEGYQLLKESGLNFTGNCEGRDIPFGCCDVVVADGFSGNVFLKSSEGVALAITRRMKEKLMEGTLSKAGALLASGKLRDMRKEFDYSEEGGAPILGVRGAVLKIHGSSKANAVYNAVLKAIPYIENDVTGRIEKAIVDSSTAQEEVRAAVERDETANE